MIRKSLMFFVLAALVLGGIVVNATFASDKQNDQVKIQTSIEKVGDQTPFEKKDSISILRKLDPDKKINAIVYLRNQVKLNELNPHLKVKQVLKTYRGKNNDFVGGYVIDDDLTLEENVELAEELHFNSLQRNIENLEKMIEKNPNSEKRIQAELLLEDLRQRLEDEEGHGISVYAYVVEGKSSELLELLNNSEIATITVEGVKPLTPIEIMEMEGEQR